jgi:hypothetical protein
MTRLDAEDMMIRINFYGENVTCVLLDGVNEDMIFSGCVTSTRIFGGNLTMNKPRS